MDIAETTAAKERPPPKKRRRVVISCTECHRRKQKCDRELPCTNCRSRCKESACTYETGAPTARAHVKKELPKASPPERHSNSPLQQPPPPPNGMPLSSMAASWGYSQTGTSTMGFLKRIEAAPVGGSDSYGFLPRGSQQEDLALRERYKGLIRQLPAKVYLDKLIDIYFRDFNWQYYALNEDVFYSQLHDWNQLPFSVLSTTGPDGLSPELRAFPAVMFQIIAIALLSLPEVPDPVFDALKYAGNMTFEDLANDYSESGAAIASLFGKMQLTLTSVVTQFLRSWFLKLTNNVTESWHVIGVAIRDAQELGLHRDSLDPKPSGPDIKDVLKNQWLIERRRRLYLVLVLWDINMALVLGRPGCVDARHNCPTLPVDALIPQDTTNTPVIPRDENADPPTPLTRLLWWNKLAEPLRDIQELEQLGAYPKDFSKVDKVHEKIMALEESKPGALREINPDTRWDGLPETRWLPDSRKLYDQLHHFSLMALHRPYMFHRQESRTEALKASLAMLDIQGKAFEGMSPSKWRDFMMFFGSFDAIVLIASIYIMYPREHAEFKSAALRKFHATVQRFSIMQERSPLARSAQGVIKAILAKFTKALEHTTTGPGAAAEVSPPGKPGSQPYGSETLESGYESATGSTVGTVTDSSLPAAPAPSSVSQWMPPTDSLAGLATLFPTSDLIYNDLTAMQGADPLLPLDGQDPTQDMGDMSWQFGGGFGEDTVWQLLNQFQPGAPG